jgi:hypothetical protein
MPAARLGRSTRGPSFFHAAERSHRIDRVGPKGLNVMFVGGSCSNRKLILYHAEVARSCLGEASIAINTPSWARVMIIYSNRNKFLVNVYNLISCSGL